MTEKILSLPKTEMNREWWRGATIYQVYPRSFCDTNGDGVGDIPGITAKLDYIASLGVDALWISPFFTSPMRDFGYDVADYCDVDPIFGTLADFDALVERAHALGLKVIIDQVYSHTSDMHSWFAASRSNSLCDKADWYVWAEAKADGTPPNNWQSVFGGPAWTWDARRGQYYMHNFLSAQPQLNLHNRQVQDAVIAAARFWLDRGVDGFRLDAINFAMHDPQLRDNPPRAPTNGLRTRSHDFQQQIYNQSHADIPIFLERFRAMLDEYGAIHTVAEVGGARAESEMHAFTAGEKRLNSAYGFNYLYADWLTPTLIAESTNQWPDTEGAGWPSWAFSNHDAPRWISRWAPPGFETEFARMTLLLFACLRGNIILWQGEELGLTQIDVPFDQLQDPEAIANWPHTLSRDGARTPMPWQGDEKHCGFTSGAPWLPLGDDRPQLAVDRQDEDPQSLLNHSKAVIALRNAHAALRFGTMQIDKADDQLLCFTRSVEGQELICIFNFSASPLQWEPPQSDRWRVTFRTHQCEGWNLPAYGGVIAEKII
jgi:alpha-glucosidase